MKLIGLVRLGRDAEVRYTPSGDAVCSFSGAFNYGKKDGDKQPSQWVDFTLWGKRAESLAPHLIKGTQLCVTASEPHIETYDKKDGGQGFKLSARVDDLQFAGPKPEQAERPAPRQAPRTHGEQRAARTEAFDDMDSDIPF